MVESECFVDETMMYLIVKEEVFGTKGISTETLPSCLHVPALLVCAWHRTWHCYTLLWKVRPLRLLVRLGWQGVYS
jgi:hypothetical protein